MEVSKEIKAKIFGLYLGANIHDAYSGKTGKLSGVTNNIVMVEFNIIHERAYSETQLTLRSLEDITDGECIEVAKMVGIKHKDKQDNVTAVRNMVVRGDVLNALNENIFTHLSVIDYLRSQSFMLPAFGIQDLFEAGVAVKKEVGNG